MYIILNHFFYDSDSFGILIQTCIFLICYFKQLLDKTHFHIFHISTYELLVHPCYQNLSLEYFGDNSKVSGLFFFSLWGTLLFFIKKKDCQVRKEFQLFSFDMFYEYGHYEITYNFILKKN